MVVSIGSRCLSTVCQILLEIGDKSMLRKKVNLAKTGSYHGKHILIHQDPNKDPSDGLNHVGFLKYALSSL